MRQPWSLILALWQSGSGVAKPTTLVHSESTLVFESLPLCSLLTARGGHSTYIVLYTCHGDELDIHVTLNITCIDIIAMRRGLKSCARWIA